ncbi:hypothetical protein [Phaeobacter phage MD18]|nr:hypothetical protein [Phaeobacter phage MD18]
MALADLLTPDSDVQEAKDTLTRTFHNLANAAGEYARASLGAATTVLEIAMEGGVCAEAYTPYTDITKYDRLARRIMENLTDITALLLAVNGSEDDYANRAYEDHLSEMSKIDETSAMLEASAARLTLINRALPSNPQPAARFDASIFRANDGAEER